MNNAKCWDENIVGKYYSENRSNPADLYRSERHFLDRVVKNGISILDIGCACGGFYNIFRQMAENIRYTGVDISEKLVGKAKTLYPEAEFMVNPPDRLEFKDSSFDLVFSSGVFHMTNCWRELYREAYRVAGGRTLVDFRLTEGSGAKGKIALDFYGQNCENYADYIVLNVDELFGALGSLAPAPKSVEAFGYMNAPSKMSDVRLKEVCMAFFLVEKGAAGNRKTDYSLELPFANLNGKIRERCS